MPDTIGQLLVKPALVMDTDIRFCARKRVP
jgi:hypothetical protein